VSSQLISFHGVGGVKKEAELIVGWERMESF
jgi:hypothetical protein